MAMGPDCATFLWPVALIAIWGYRWAVRDQGSLFGSSHAAERRRAKQQKPPEEEIEVDPGWDQGSGRPRRAPPGTPPAPPRPPASPPGSPGSPRAGGDSSLPPLERSLDPEDEW